MKNRIKTIVTTAACSLVLVSAVSAQAQEDSTFGSEGQFSIGGERLTGYHSYKGTAEMSYEGHSAKGTVSGSQVSLGFANPMTANEHFDINPSAFPRVGADYFVIDGLSLGLSAGFFTMSSEAKDDGSGETEKGVDYSGFAVYPRIGYQIGFNDMWGLWLRGGFSYYQFTAEGSNSSKRETSFQELTIEGLFNVTLAPGFGLMFGPTFDIGIGGKQENWDSSGTRSPVDTKLTWTDIGGNFGVFGYL